MLKTIRKPATAGEILAEEFMAPMGLTQAAPAVPRKRVNELCDNRRSVTAATALILTRVFGNSAAFWRNVQRRADTLGGAAFAARKRTHCARPTVGSHLTTHCLPCAAHVNIAIEAFRRFGKGRRRAALNIGDCFAYALAAATGEPRLFTGNDFTHTDIRSALPRAHPPC
jgi:addiction module HigA family antidote